MYAVIKTDSTEGYLSFCQSLHAGGLTRYRLGFGHPENPLVVVDEGKMEIHMEIPDGIGSRVLPYRINRSGELVEVSVKHVKPSSVSLSGSSNGLKAKLVPF